MSDILAQIVKYKRDFVASSKIAIPLEDIKKHAADTDTPINFFAAVTTPAHQLRVIAEVKKASPSAGIIRQDFHPATIAKTYEQNGAAAISCLTDEKYFQGSLAYIADIKAAVSLPIIRKDFIIDPYQLYEARAAGADAVLLIAECIPDQTQLADMLILATELKLTTLLEIHDSKNLARVQPLIKLTQNNKTLLGINNRNLKKMTTDINHTLRLLKMVEDPSIVVSESGIKTFEDIQKLQSAGVHRVLVGEHLMRQPDIGLALRQLMGKG